MVSQPGAGPVAETYVRRLAPPGTRKLRGSPSGADALWGIAIGCLALISLILTWGSPLGLASVVLAGCTIWLITPTSVARPGKWLTVMLIVLAFSSLLPAGPGVLTQFVALAGPFALWALARDAHSGEIVFWCAALCAIWLALALHPNVPDISTGLLGARLSTMALGGLVFGLSFRGRNSSMVENSLIAALTIAVGVSVATHLLAPGFDFGIERSAGVWTETFHGEARLQGVFAGPFHMAIAGVLLVAWGFFRWSEKRIPACVAIGVGLAAAYLSLVRTAYPALLAVVLAAIACSPTSSVRARRMALASLGVLLFLLLAITARGQFAGIVESLAGFGSDSRLLNRFPGYVRALEMFRASPVIGWGAGSAGDGLAQAFASAVHINSHNVPLKILVEGGIVGGVAWAALGSALLRAGKRGSGLGLGLAVLAVLGVFGMVIPSIEALPVSWFAFALVGLSLGRARPAPLS